MSAREQRRSPSEAQPLLDVSNLKIEFLTQGRYFPVVEDVAFQVGVQESVGIVGESGSGKTVTSLSLMKLLPRSARIASGSIRFEGRDLVGLTSKELEEIRGRDIAMVFQDPMNSLNPAFTVGNQVTEAILAHEKIQERQAFERAVELLDMVGIPAARKRAQDYPHQFSGGMAQRALIAMAIACRPKLLIADEPVTALDVTIRAQILELLQSLREQLGMSLIMISHDLGVVAHLVDRVVVMYAGHVVEENTTRGVFVHPQHPYTEALIKARPDASPKGERLPSIPGTVPRVGRMPLGCRFAPRCAYSAESCSTDIVAFSRLSVGGVRCVRHSELQLQGVEIESENKLPDFLTRAERPQLLSVRSLSRYFPVHSGLLRRVSGFVRAVDGVEFDIAVGETVGLVGETGSGKSTIARLVLRLLEPTSGEVWFDGQNIAGIHGKSLREIRRDMQMVFQNPYGSLDPRSLVAACIGEPLEVHLRMTSAERNKRIASLLDLVGLDTTFAQRYPSELSGGQCQRVAIARALALNPRLIVCDEPVSSLDVSTQAQVLNLLMDLRDELGISYLFISHDLSVVHHVSDRIAVMYLGQIVELSKADNVYSEPKHPYTRALLSAVLLADPRSDKRRIPLKSADLPSPLNPPPGCRFHTRCPDAMELCKSVPPPGVTFDDGAWVACHLYARVSDRVSVSVPKSAS